MARRYIYSLHRYMPVFLLLFCGCFSAQAQFNGQAVNPNTPVNIPTTVTTDPAILFPQRPPLVLDQGDLLSVHIYGSTDYTPVVRVAADGTIQLPLIGIITVRDLTVEQAEQLIAKALVDAGMYKNPQVNIQVTETPNHVVNVVGEVKAPLLVPVAAARTLLDALNSAGGILPSASHTITILRPSVPDPIVVDLGSDPMHSAASNVPVFSGDTIIVSRVGSFYVLGSVEKQGVYSLEPNSPTTVIDALAEANGPLFEARKNKVHIIRTVGNTRKEVTVDIGRIVAGKDPDPIIASDDIIYIPGSALKAAIKSGGIATVLGVASLIAIFAYH
jgi:polysaccharide export outer membrane protein